ncbi:1-acyl-sn-glycerol-3-phosphate acyltransferase [Lactococcus hodotermopsidis]|uniref:1-acyl-sn-glycerol-3-phosphate acyltransferase n=1 Tax=Pseudolactococcus hodotermopsidis TaxID=2709157 RepID=A0A6A0BC43_9LACT|nr:1-acyl-sn-glycerol-3-phosphate acyltransferase [Lactococcus hodotermopsidis]GFH42912.1 1-acyl-sn-glycerol-3-phosphate acyltransferase [Lactococcus hodotermopsidis]
MFFVYLKNFVIMLLWMLNGNAHFHNKDKIPDSDENYVFVAPHRTWWDPVYMAFATKPKQFIFMAKRQLFKNPFFGFWIEKCGAFPIDRDNPNPSTIKYPVKMLKTSKKSLIMFPSGSRHSTDIKGGVALIAKMAKVRIMPSVYQGPLSFGGLMRRERIDMNFGNLIDISDIKKMDAAGIAEVSRRIEAEFERLDAEIDTVHRAAQRPMIFGYIPRLILLIPVLMLTILTIFFTVIATPIYRIYQKLKK